MQRLNALALSITALTLVSACTAPIQAPSAAPGTLVHGGRILLNDGEQPVVEALLASGNRVLAVGTEAELRALPAARDALELDLAGATAVPGLVDAHGHLQGYGAALENVDLRGATSFTEVVERVRASAERAPAGSWILGRGWDQNLWTVQEFPHHAELSAAIPGHPVYLARIDGHAALANEAALEAAGLLRVFEAPPTIVGGRLFLGSDRRPTGVLLDGAMSLVSDFVPPPSAATTRARYLTAQRALVAYGLTAVHDMGISRAEFAVLEDLRRSGELCLRVVAYLSGGGEFDEGSLQGLPIPGDDDGWLALVGVKLYMDGALGSRGAALLADYSDAPGERGLVMYDAEELARRVGVCAAHGLQPAVHAIGDRGNRLVLDAFQTVAERDPRLRALRPRVEHAQVVAPEDAPRFETLGAIPSVQPTHATSDMDWVRARLGPARTLGAYAWRTLAGKSVALAFGSDFPVESPNPLEGLFAARTRRHPGAPPASALHPEQCVDGAAALAGFTSGAAHAVHEESRRGRLSPGFAFDMTVLDVDPTRCAPEELLAAKVVLTIVNGRIVYRAP